MLIEVAAKEYLVDIEVAIFYLDNPSMKKSLVFIS